MFHDSASICPAIQKYEVTTFFLENMVQSEIILFFLNVMIGTIKSSLLSIFCQLKSGANNSIFKSISFHFWAIWPHLLRFWKEDRLPISAHLVLYQAASKNECCRTSFPEFLAVHLHSFDLFWVKWGGAGPIPTKKLTFWSQPCSVSANRAPADLSLQSARDSPIPKPLLFFFYGSEREIGKKRNNDSYPAHCKKNNTKKIMLTGWPWMSLRIRNAKLVDSHLLCKWEPFLDPWLFFWGTRRKVKTAFFLPFCGNCWCNRCTPESVG